MPLAHRIIRSEHFEIKLILTCLNRLSEALKKELWTPDFDLMFSILDYIESFPETFHHPKEEDFLFAAIRRRSPEAGPLLDQLCDEHAEGVGLMNELRMSLVAYKDASSACGWYCDTARRYVKHERRHIEREERTLMPLSLPLLDAEDWLQIDAAFVQNDHPLLGPARQEFFDKLFADILKRVPGKIVFKPKEATAA